MWSRPLWISSMLLPWLEFHWPLHMQSQQETDYSIDTLGYPLSCLFCFFCFSLCNHFLSRFINFLFQLIIIRWLLLSKTHELARTLRLVMLICFASKTLITLELWNKSLWASVSRWWCLAKWSRQWSLGLHNRFFHPANRFYLESNSNDIIHGSVVMVAKPFGNLRLQSLLE